MKVGVRKKPGIKFYLNNYCIDLTTNDKEIFFYKMENFESCMFSDPSTVPRHILRAEPDRASRCDSVQGQEGRTIRQFDGLVLD